MDALKFAIKMELEGEQYYLRQAEVNKENGLDNVFKLLAREEKSHAELLKEFALGKAAELKLHDTVNEVQSIFDGMGDFKSEIKQSPYQIDAYRMALDKEKESIALYRKMREAATDYKAKELYDFLICEEEAHLSVLDELSAMLQHAEQWAESAEFGLRPEY